MLLLLFLGREAIIQTVAFILQKASFRSDPMIGLRGAKLGSHILRYCIVTYLSLYATLVTVRDKTLVSSFRWAPVSFKKLVKDQKNKTDDSFKYRFFIGALNFFECSLSLRKTNSSLLEPTLLRSLKSVRSSGSFFLNTVFIIDQHYLNETHSLAYSCTVDYNIILLYYNI